MVIHKAAPRSLRKRLDVELRDAYGTEAPEVLHLWAESRAPLRGVTLKAHVQRGGIERVAVGSAPKWEAAYQQLLSACLDAWGPADPTSVDSIPASEDQV